MISQEDFSVISRLDSGDPASRDKVTASIAQISCGYSSLAEPIVRLSDLIPSRQVAKEAPQQCAKTLYNLLGHISKDQTVRHALHHHLMCTTLICAQTDHNTTC